MSSTSGTGTLTSLATSRARAPCRCGRAPSGRRRSRRRRSRSSTERARTRCPGRPATFSTRWAGGTTACSRKGCPGGSPRVMRSRAAIPGPRRRTEMRSVGELAKAAEEARALVARQPAVVEAEVFAASNSALLTRLNYTSHIPCNGVEEPKSSESYGLGIQAVFDAPDGRRIGCGSEPSDLTAAGAERALAKARKAAVADPEFVSLPAAATAARSLRNYHDPRLLDLDGASLVEAGWKITGGALRTFTASSRLAKLAGDDEALRRLGLILRGGGPILRARLGVASRH